MNQLYSKFDLANKALLKIGAKRLSSLGDGSVNSVIINDIYDQCLCEVLEEHPWSFAVNTVALVTLSAVLVNFTDGISVAYGLPEDFLYPYLFSIPNAQYRIETLKPPVVTQNTIALLSDQAGLVMKYVFKNDDPTTYTAKFYDTLSCKIALECCFKISEAAGMAAAMQSKYDKALLSAMAADSKFSQPDQPRADEWFIARLAGSGVVSGLPNGNIGFFADPFNPDF